MSSTPYFPFYPADYLADTAHLTTEQHGAYLLLLMASWRAGGRLPSDPKKLARVARVSTRRWHLIADDILAFFEVDGEEIVSDRMEREHKKAVSKSAKRSAAGKRGGRAKALKKPDRGLANAKQKPCHSPEPEPEDTTLDSARASLPTDFASRVTAAAEPGIADPAKSPGVMVMSEPLSWLRSGADLEADILPTLTALGARASPGSIRSWGYFTAAVMEAKARREREHETPEISHGKPDNRKAGGFADRYRASADTQQSAWLRAVAEPGGGGSGDERPERPGGDQGGDGRTALRIATG